MLSFKKYLLEKYTRNVIVVDIQPMYEEYHSKKFKTWKFCEFLNKSRNILYFYNGQNTVGEDTEEDLKYWLIENELNEDKLDDIKFYDKGYGFFRNYMDIGISEHIIIKMIRILFQKKVLDSRDIEIDEWEELLGDDFEEVSTFLDIEEAFYIPDINIGKLKEFDGSYIVGGGKNECLKEVQLLMSAFNIKAKMVSDFVY